MTDAASAVVATRGDIGIATVESLSQEGVGVAHVDGKAVFIQGALPGEHVRFRYHNKKKKYDTGVMIELLQPSPDRVVPRCEYFGVCGGCGLQHLQPSAQLQAKEKVLLSDLAHIGKVTPESILPPLASEPWHYRRKARLGARMVEKKGGLLLGFREKRSAYITNLAHCETLHPDVAQRLPALRALIAALSCAARIPQVEVAAGDNAALFVFRHLEPLTADDERQLREFGRTQAVWIGVQPGDPNSVRMLWPQPPANSDLYYELRDYGLRFYFAPTDFIQVNGAMNAAMVRQALALLQPQKHERVLDLFCGLGNFTLPLARQAGTVLGVEGEAALIARAQRNAEANDVANVNFRVANLFETAAVEGLWQTPWDKMLLDPPRTGAIEVVKTIPADGPRRIVYVSCNPATLARDAEVLVAVKGYRLRSAGVMDMFPQTTHTEAMALFERP